MSEEGNPAGLSSCSGGLRPLVELCVEPAGLCGRCMGMAVPLRVVIFPSESHRSTPSPLLPREVDHFLPPFFFFNGRKYDLCTGGVQTAKASRKQSSLSGKESAQGCVPTPLASRVAQGVSGPSSSCVWNPRVFVDDAWGWQCPFVLCLHPQGP